MLHDRACIGAALGVKVVSVFAAFSSRYRGFSGPPLCALPSSEEMPLKFIFVPFARIWRAERAAAFLGGTQRV